MSDIVSASIPKPVPVQLKIEAKLTNQKMGPYLKSLRHDACLTMRGMADIIDTPHSFIGKIEKQNRRLDVGEFIHYCIALGKDPVEALQEVVAL